MQSKVLSRKPAKGFLDRLYRHARESGHPEGFEIPGFRLALAVASLAGMTVELFNGFWNPERALTGLPMKTFRG
jgi:hypothetical protein